MVAHHRLICNSQDLQTVLESVPSLGHLLPWCQARSQFLLKRVSAIAPSHVPESCMPSNSSEVHTSGHHLTPCLTYFNSCPLAPQPNFQLELPGGRAQVGSSKVAAPGDHQVQTGNFPKRKKQLPLGMLAPCCQS